MYFKEFKQNIDFIYKCLNSYEDPEIMPVGVVLSTPSIGGRRIAPITSVSLGVDWETGRVNIETDTELVPKGRTCDDIVNPVEEKADNSDMVYYYCRICNEKVGKTDKYCRCCGQRLRD